MNRRCICMVVVLGLILTAPLVAWTQGDETGDPEGLWMPERPWESIDLVIALDTSDSMQGLIDAVRLNLWAIVNDLTQAEPTPHLRVALLTYGNSANEPKRGWVRIETELTEDLDLVSAKLFELTTQGGTEYVARVLEIAINDLRWTSSNEATKLILVAGNESADLDPALTLSNVGSMALREGIWVTAIYCGRTEQADAQSWRELADRTFGYFAAIDHRGGTMVVKTAYDKELVRLSADLNKTFVPLGKAGRERAENMERQDRKTKELSLAAAAGRAQTKSRSGYTSGWELVGDLESGKRRLSEIDADDLPVDLRDISTNDLAVLVDEMSTRREELRRQIAELGEKRRLYIAEQLSSKGLKASRSFNTVVLPAIRSRVEEKGFRFPER